MRSFLCSSIFITLFFFSCYSQSSFIGVKGGLSLNQQRWNNFERDILFTPHIDVFAESYDGLPSRLYASLGFHTRGSAIRGFNFTSFASYKFNNLVLEIGGKRMVTSDKKYNGYYLLGLRGEYTLNTNFGELNPNSLLSLVDNQYVNKFNYGVTVGGGFEHTISEDKIVFLELSINPDLSRQYQRLQPFSYTGPDGIMRTLGSQEVRNFSMELTVGMKFMRGYIDEDDYE